MDPIWNKIHATHPWGRYPSEDVIRTVMHKHGHLPPLERAKVRILDLGCGGGATTWFLDRELFDWYGMDGSLHAAEKTVENSREQAENRVKVGNFCDKIPWENGYFDGVIDHFSLYSNPENAQKEAISEVLRVLKPGGWLFSAHFGKDSMGFYSGIPDQADPLGSLWVGTGPLRDRGYVRFTTDMDLRYRLAGFARVEVAEQVRTTLPGGHRLQIFLALAEKAAA